MTQEEKQLLLVDLCARLPYNVKGLINGWEGIIYPHDIEDLQKDLRTIKPYLRPMSSMTEEERKEYKKLLEEVFMGNMPYIRASTSLYDWLNAHHFDYRGLIHMRLALEAPSDMYK